MRITACLVTIGVIAASASAIAIAESSISHAKSLLPAHYHFLERPRPCGREGLPDCIASDHTTPATEIHWPQQATFAMKHDQGRDRAARPIRSGQLTNGQRLSMGLTPNKPARMWDAKRRAALQPRWSGAPAQDTSSLYNFQGCYDFFNTDITCDLKDYCDFSTLGSAGQYGQQSSQTDTQRVQALDDCIAHCISGGGAANLAVGFTFEDGNQMACGCGIRVTSGNVIACTNADENYASYLGSGSP